jgi:8-oxo-dGTP pyrophosphatase MutT (NUDIX family)
MVLLREIIGIFARMEQEIMVVQPRMAATVMLLREGADSHHGIEVFMVRRVVQSEFMPDLYVFPGGSVSPEDGQVESTPELCVPLISTEADPEGRTALSSGLRAAAIRELFEEGNILLAYQEGKLLAISEETSERFRAYRRAFHERTGSLLNLARTEHLVLATDALAYFSHWITPEGLPKRFDTHFFLAAAPTEQEALYDEIETSAGIWITPLQALERYEEGTFPLAFPTFHQLRDLSVFPTVPAALRATTTRYVPTRQPILAQKETGLHTYLAEDPKTVWKI